MNYWIKLDLTTLATVDVLNKNMTPQSRCCIEHTTLKKLKLAVKVKELVTLE